jgi:hypothetical protein
MDREYGWRAKSSNIGIGLGQTTDGEKDYQDIKASVQAEIYRFRLEITNRTEWVQ